MKKALILLAFAGCIASCDKEESTNIFPDDPVLPTAVTGKFKIDFDSLSFRIDSIRGYYLNASGFLDSTITVGKYSWESPVRRYDKLDSGYAAVKAYGIRRVSNASIPEMKFSEDFSSSHFTVNQSIFTFNSVSFFQSKRGFRF